MTNVIVLNDLDPTKVISANKRIHHMTRAAVQSYWRTLARQTALNAYGHADDGCTWHHRIRIQLEVRFPDRRRHDVGNLYPYVAKPIVDGLVDARLVPDDDDHHVIGPDLRRDPDKGPHRIRIVITDLQPAEVA